MMETRWRELDRVGFSIPFLPPSVNAIYQVIFSQKRVEMKPDVMFWKTKAKEYVPKIAAHADVMIFKVDAVFHYPWYHKNGKFRKFDTQNLIKVLCDAVSEKIGFPDERFKVGSWDSVDEERQGVDVEVLQLGVGLG